MNLAWGKVREPADVVEQPTLVSRGAIVQMDDRAGGTRPLTQSPYRFSAATSGVRGLHHIGEHNAVLEEWLGYDETAVGALMIDGACKKTMSCCLTDTVQAIICMMRHT